MDILIFIFYRTVRSTIKTNKQILHNLKGQKDFEICFILRFSFRLKMLKFYFRKNSSIILVHPPQLHNHQVWAEEELNIGQMGWDEG
jgi:hypothetical protein